MAVRRSLIVLGGGLAVAGSVAIAAALTGGANPSQVDSLALDLDARFREVSAAVQARTETLAQLPRLAWAVATDEQTVLDLTAEELAFKPQPGESIAIGQIMRADGHVVPLLHLGVNDVVHLPLVEPGRHLIVSGDQLHVVEVASVEPRTRANELRGAVALSRPLDLEPLRAQVAALGAAAQLNIGDAVLRIGSPVSGAQPLTVRLSSDPGVTITFQLPHYNRTSLMLYLLALALAAVTIGIAILFYRSETAGPAAHRPLQRTAG